MWTRWWNWPKTHSLFLFDLGYFELAAFATIAAAQAYFLSRLNHQNDAARSGGRAPAVFEFGRLSGARNTAR